jgi:hypothetical protein
MQLIAQNIRNGAMVFAVLVRKAGSPERFDICRIVILKVLSSEMDRAEIRLIR